VTIDVRHCARCQQDHDAVEFKPLTNAPPECSHWAMCPVTNEPILMLSSFAPDEWFNEDFSGLQESETLP
jgi:recombinational DNA repair protein (RecF pathway)